ALEGIDLAYYLLHSMEPAIDGAFHVREHVAAENFARACQTVATPRLVYLGGPVPSDAALSPHLASRLGVEQILLQATPCSVALRAAIIIGADSRSFRFLVRLMGPMMESLEQDLLIPENSAVELLGVRLHSLDAAIERALREWEEREPLAAR